MRFVQKKISSLFIFRFSSISGTGCPLGDVLILLRWLGHDVDLPEIPEGPHDVADAEKEPEPFYVNWERHRYSFPAKFDADKKFFDKVRKVLNIHR